MDLLVPRPLCLMESRHKKQTPQIHHEQHLMQVKWR